MARALAGLVPRMVFNPWLPRGHGGCVLFPLGCSPVLGTGYFLLVFEAITGMKTFVTAQPKLQFSPGLVERHVVHRRQTRDEHTNKEAREFIN